MRPLIKNLYTLLLEQKDTLEALLELSTEERRIIISGEGGLLEDIVRKEMKELSKLNAIEKKRTALHPQLAEEFGLSSGEITVSAIAARAAADERDAIKKLQTQLMTLLTRHKELNAENRQLIETHFEYTQAVMEIMVDPEDPLNNFYGIDGKAAPDRKKTTGFFDGRS